MESINIRFNRSEDAEELARLSKEFADENSCNGITADDADFFDKHKVAIAVDKNKIVGYCFGEIEKENKTRAYAKENDLYYYLEEIYIIPEYRSKGVGQVLFQFIEQYAKEEGCKTIRLSAVSKDYKKLLSFYIDKLNMTFWSAFLIKEI